MLQSFLFAAALLFVQDEAEYDRLLMQVREAVALFKEPDGAFMPPGKYWDEALQNVDKVLNFQPTREFEGAYQLISAMKHFTAGSVQAALEDFRHGLRVDPNSVPMFHFGLGMCYSALGRYGESENEFKLAAEAAPGWGRPRTALAAIYLETGRAGEAETAAGEGIELTDSVRARGRQYLLLAQARQARGVSDGAEDALTKALEMDPEDALLPDYLGLHKFNRGGKDQALAVWKRALAAFPGNAALTREISLAENGMKTGSWPNTFRERATSSLGPANPLLPGGSRYRAFRIQASAGEVLRFRTESGAFQPFTLLLSADGKPVALHDIRSSYFSLVEYAVKAPGAYFLIVSSYFPGHAGEFTVSRLK
jgi:tetratricopeptide (TPR) repeat protein